MRPVGFAATVLVLGLFAAPACAQSWGGSGAAVISAPDLTAQLNRQSAFTAAALAPSAELTSDDSDLSLWAATERTVWTESASGGAERLRLRTRGSLIREDGSPLPPGPLDRAAVSPEDMDVSYLAEGRSTVLASGSGLEVTLTPHAAVGVGTRGASAEAGATVRVGPSADILPDGREAFGERARWYFYAAGTGRAVGYNLARNRDGEFDRSGYSTDRGIYLGDASVGVAWRKGDMQTALGLVYRELEPGALVHPGQLGDEVSEGLLAFSLSIKPN